MAVKELQNSVDLPNINTAPSTAFRRAVVVAGATQSVGQIYAALESALEPVILVGAGPHAITHDDHSNRGVSIAGTGYAEFVFAVAATSGALDQDFVSIYNGRDRPIQTSGVFIARPGFKTWVAPGETLLGLFNAADNVYYSQTLDIRKAGREPSFSVIPASNVATLSTVGAAAPALLSTSALAAVTSAATDRYTHHQRIAINQATTTSGQYGGTNILAANSTLLVPTDVIPYGFKLRCIGGINDAIAAGSFAMGITSSTVTGAEPSTFINCILFGGNSTDANMQIMHKAGSGAMTKVDLGSSFPNHTNAADMYEFILEFRGDGSFRSVQWIAVNLTSGAVARERITTNLPVAGTAVSIFIVRSNQSSTGTAGSIHFGGFYAGGGA